MKERDLKKQVQKTEKEILDENREWFDGFMHENYPNYKTEPEKQSKQSFQLKKKWIFIGSSVATALVIILSFVLLWPLMFPTPDEQPKKHYFLENERFKISDLTELNSDLQNNLSLIFNTGYEVEIRQTYDLITNDKLYYRAELTKSNEETDERIVIYLYINTDYIIAAQIENDMKTDSINGFDLKYNEIIENDYWAYTFKYNAITEKYKDITIYIEYEQLSLDENSNFFNFFEQTFQKN